MLKPQKLALQAALILSVLLSLSIALLSFTGNIGAVTSNAGILVPLVALTFVVTSIFWRVAFPSEKSGSWLLRAAWVGALIPLFVILILVIFGREGFDSGKLVNGGTILYLLVMLLGALFIPTGICAALAVRWFQTRKMDGDSSVHKNTSFGISIVRGVGHLTAFVFIIAVALQAVSYLTDDYVGQKEENLISAMGYQFKIEIENYYNQNAIYPETLNELPTAQSEHFTKYRKWRAFGYRATDTSGYSLLWRYHPSNGIICSTDMWFWPGAASMRTENISPPPPNYAGCYSVNPEEIRKPPWLK